MQTNIFDYLKESAKRVPNKIFLTDSDISLSFKEVYEDALLIGKIIQEKTSECNKPIGVITGRKVFSVVSFLGVLASGNFYVPIDEKMPEERKRKISDQLNFDLVIDEDFFLKAISSNKDDISLTEERLALVRENVLSVDPCYVLFSSGSTGIPKGIVVNHRSVIDFTEWYTDCFKSTEQDVCGNQPPFYFDASCRDLFPMLKVGGSIHILQKKLFMFPMLLCKYIEENKINTLNWSTSAFNLIANSKVLEKYAPKSLKKIVLGGESLKAKEINVWKTFLPDVLIANVYGPTEATVDCSYYILDREFRNDEEIPIGRPCSNVDLLVLKEDGTRCLKNEVGELCIRGTSLSLGYIGDFEKTSLSFTQNPLNNHYPETIYHTGDFVKQSEDDNLYFVGRKDSLIKHAGYRIELGEIETSLLSLGEIKEGVVLFNEKEDKIVCIYQGDIDKDSLANKLRSILSEYMVPSIYIRLDNLPHNANSKIDRRALKESYLCSN